MAINWMDEVLKRKEQLIKDTQSFLRIKSVLDESTATDAAPLGKGIDEALRHLLARGEEEGFAAKNLDGLAGHLEMGQGEELLGILCHIDVVPEGDGWTSDPYGAENRDGKIFARGALDDKGPTMAAFYAMKIVKESGLPLNKRIRMIIGTDEESDWRCVDHYFKHEEMPTMGFAPDADFPIIYAEKGISDFDLCQNSNLESNDGEANLQSFQSGLRYNMVPDFAEAVVSGSLDQQALASEYDSYLKKAGVEGQSVQKEGGIVLTLKGVSAHGMEPDNGKNAGLLMLGFLKTLSLDSKASQFVDYASTFFIGDSRGKSLGVNYSDDITGDLTMNVGKLSYSPEEGGRLGINLRYPVTNDMELTRQRMEAESKAYGMEIRNFSDSKPHHVDKDHILIKTLQKVYTEQTGEEAVLVSIGGGTYARSLKAGVAFGPLFPGRPDIAHQKDEYMFIDDLLKATAIYAQAIYELAK